MLRRLEPKPEDESGSSLGLVAVEDVTLCSSCTCREQGFRIIKWSFIKIVAVCSLSFLQSFIQVLIFFLFIVFTAHTPLFFFLIYIVIVEVDRIV